MGRPPADSCNCCPHVYNIRKLRISDGQTVWRRMLLYPPGSEIDPENPDAHVPRDVVTLAKTSCCRGRRLVVNLGGHAVGVSTATGNILWTDSTRLLIDSNTLYRVIDADAAGNWIGAFYNEPLGLVNADNVRQWSYSGLWTPTRVKLGNGTFVAYREFTSSQYGIAYGNSADGTLIYEGNTLNALATTSVISDIVDEKAQAVFEQPIGTPGNRMFDLPSYLPEGGFPSLPPYAYTDGVTTNDAVSQTLSGRQAYFYATHYNGLAVDYRTSLPLVGTKGILKVDFEVPASYRFSMLSLGSVPWRLHKCSDGIVAIFKQTSFTHNGLRFEIVKTDYDLNVLWMKRWTQESTFPGWGSPINAAEFQLTGVSGDSRHVYIAGTHASWSDGHT